MQFKRLTVALDHDRTAPAVKASAEKLVQVLMALLHNAADAVMGRIDTGGSDRNGERRTTGGQPVSIEVPAQCLDRSPSGRGACGSGSFPSLSVEVEDAESDSPARFQIFEPFFTTTKATGRGGPGLSVCYGIVADRRPSRVTSKLAWAASFASTPRAGGPAAGSDDEDDNV
jgi:signal transduction histidine kinase